MKNFWIKKVIKIIFFVALGIVGFGFVVMGLWNAILPVVLGVKVITFWQALGILVLSKILFGGFGGRGFRGGGSHAWKQKMKERWQGMTPEEREKMKAEWKNRCGARWGKASVEE